MARIINLAFIASLLFRSDAAQHHEWKTFAFASSETPFSEWKRYDWDKLTTVAVFGERNVSKELLDFAHQRQCRVVKVVNVPDADLDSESVLARWVARTVAEAVELGLDGANLDYEGPVAAGSARAKALTRLLVRLVDAFHAAIPGSEVSVDVAWRPGCVDGRCYQYQEMGRAADLVFVMGYDLQSQMWGDPATNCSARPNSPAPNVTSGLRQYLDLGIEPRKMVLGVPWYGYVYPCRPLSGARCRVRSAPFRGCPCSDAAGRQMPYGEIERTRRKHRARKEWQYISQTPVFDFYENGTWFQVQYDNARSLAVKYNLAKYQMKIGGVGMWNANLLDYGRRREAAEMWKALPKKTDGNLLDSINIGIII